MLKKDFEIFKNTILRAKFVLENEKSFEKWIIKFIYGIWLILWYMSKVWWIKWYCILQSDFNKMNHYLFYLIIFFNFFS